MTTHHIPQNFSDRFAFYTVKAMRCVADKFFAKRYGNRAIVLETVAGVPGMVGGMFRHMRSLRRMEDDEGKIKVLLDEAENERMHLLTFIEIGHPTQFERIIVLIVQGVVSRLPAAMIVRAETRNCTAAPAIAPPVYAFSSARR